MELPTSRLKHAFCMNVIIQLVLYGSTECVCSPESTAKKAFDFNSTVDSRRLSTLVYHSAHGISNIPPNTRRIFPAHRLPLAGRQSTPGLASLAAVRELFTGSKMHTMDLLIILFVYLLLTHLGSKMHTMDLSIILFVYLLLTHLGMFMYYLLRHVYVLFCLFIYC